MKRRCARGTRKIGNKYYTLYERVGIGLESKKIAAEIAEKKRTGGYYACIVKWDFGKQYGPEDYAVYIFPKDSTPARPIGG